MPEKNKIIEGPGIGSLKFSDQPRLSIDDVDWQAFLSACEDLKIPLDGIDRTIISELYTHLVGVNRWMNLTRLTSARDFLFQHVLDSLSALPIINGLNLHPEANAVDLGAGGGYPGLILMQAKPEYWWTLVDSRRKKVDFLNEAVTVTRAEHSRALSFRGCEVRSAAKDIAGQCELVTARAVAQADKLLVESQHFFSRGGYLVIYKGPAYTGEERQRAEKVCIKSGFRAVDVHTLRLTADGEERHIAVFQKR